MEKRIVCLFLVVVLTLTGCAGTAGTGAETTVSRETETKEPVKEETYIVEQPVYSGEISFELPVSTLRALVSRNGYQTDRDKLAFFLGENLTGGFRVVREGDWEVVYSGTVQAPSAEEARYEHMSVGDFSEVTEPGTYYIEQDQVGRSYTFTISESPYEQVFRGLLENILNGMPNTEKVSAADVPNVAFGMHSMMLALQCHGVLFETDNNLVMQLLQTAEWLMMLQDKTTGSMFEDYEATAAFCGILAQSADTFGKYDSKISKEFMEASKKAWSWLEKQKEQEVLYAPAQFYAATQLFKVEGTRNYKIIIEKYLETRETKITESRFSFYGSVIYLNTIKDTNRDLCTEIMQELVAETEEIGQRSKENPYLVYTSDIEQNLQKALLICFVDYITPSNEYAKILENTLHYLMGRNETGSRYLDESGVWVPVAETIHRNPEWNGILLFCLSDLLNDAADNVE